MATEATLRSEKYNMQATMLGRWLPITNSQQSNIDHRAIAKTNQNGRITNDEKDNPNKEIQSSTGLDPNQRSLQANNFNRPEQSIASGYAQLIAARMEDGWSAYLVGFNFNHFFGQRHVVLARMEDEIQRIYSTLITQVNRKPRTAPTDRLPILIGVADLPVAKSLKVKGSTSCNGGLHFHAILVIPPGSRLKGSLVDHFAAHADRYIGPDKSVADIHVQPITHDIDCVISYVFKSVTRGRFSYDDAVFVLPRTRSELCPCRYVGLNRSNRKAAQA